MKKEKFFQKNSVNFSSTIKKNKLKKKKLVKEKNKSKDEEKDYFEFNDYFFNPMLDLWVKFFQLGSNTTGFNYLDNMKLDHFKTMYKKFQYLKDFDLKSVTFQNLKQIDLQGFCSNNKTLILDLDETLVYCTLKCYNRDATPIPGPIEGQIIFVHKRPFLDEFLQKMSKIFTLVIYSAASDSYV